MTRTMTTEPRSGDMQPSRVDDRALAARVAGGDHAAFEQLMRRYNRRLYRLARATLRDDAQAEDVLQEAYLAAFRTIGRFRGDASLSTWLSRLVLNACLTRQRRGARRDNIAPMVNTSSIAGFERTTMDADLTSSPDHALMRTELRALLERKLDALPEAFRLVFVLRCVEELSVEETAQCLGIPEATVRSRHFRAKRLLRESLAREIDSAGRDVFSFAGERCDRIVRGVLARLISP
ncbi:RNA polymerase sigma factor [Burkholderia pseudomallei]|nr:RNA polymerase subunit sigma [Burkholderia pseudomallei]OMU22426.1 RNA polymerase subunit sigma [Burkholderia pseudomallei]OMU33234.1 RNA polymerase subunit sigma [Burkholderia pseudomallei]OMU77925.1 RNA polymerase subunit sigma [Burkholderia pseudomallei]OMU83356.1 RNA polymerase subunit sigma [Burkholderia pseudomallei]